MTFFRVSLQSNDTYAFRDQPSLNANQRLHQGLIPDMSGASNDDVRRCRECHELIDKWNESLLRLVVNDRHYDLSLTYDGILVASNRFAEIYNTTGLEGLLIRQLPSDPEFNLVKATRAVCFDYVKRKTRFGNRCPLCGLYDSVVGATPVFLKTGTVVKDREFVRSDLEFGSSDEKHPLLLCGHAAAEALVAASLKGVVVVPA